MALWTTKDETLMQRVQQRDDQAAFADLVHRWQAILERAAHRMLNDRHKSEDIVQETFSRLYLKRSQYRANAKFSSYLWRILVNLCQDEFRRRQSASRFLESVGNFSDLEQTPGDEDCPQTKVERLETVASVRQALDALPDAIRVVVVLRHYEDLKFREIAAVLDIPEGTAKTRMAQGLNLLAKALQPTITPDPEASGFLSLKAISPLPR
jgi:RNA polymerase sigma-70 factor, ECF subfamily